MFKTRIFSTKTYPPYIHQVERMWAELAQRWPHAPYAKNHLLLCLPVSLPSEKEQVAGEISTNTPREPSRTSRNFLETSKYFKVRWSYFKRSLCVPTRNWQCFNFSEEIIITISFVQTNTGHLSILPTNKIFSFSTAFHFLSSLPCPTQRNKQNFHVSLKLQKKNKNSSAS